MGKRERIIQGDRNKGGRGGRIMEGKTWKRGEDGIRKGR